MLISQVRKLFDKLWSASPKRPRRRAADATRARLGVEVLEDRVVPSGFSVVGSQLRVTGTAGHDVFTFAAGNKPVVSLNGKSYTVNPVQIHSIVFNGMGGGDQATLTDTTGFENELALSPNHGTLTGNNYSLTVNNVANITAHGSANSSASLYGSAAGPNVFTGTSNDSSLTEPDASVLEAVNFGYVYAYSGTSADVATLIGSSTEGNTFDGTDLIGNETYQVQTYGFSQVTAFAGTLDDGAYLFADTTVPNSFVGDSDHAILSNSNTQATAYGFRYVTVHAGTASDTADLNGSHGWPSTFLGGASSSTLSASYYQIEVDGFAIVSATAGNGSDVASLSAPPTGTNIFTVTQNNAYLSGDGYSLSATGFTTIYSYAGTPDDEAHFYVPTTPDSLRHTFVGTQYYSTLTTTDRAGNTYFRAEADNFQKVYATGNNSALKSGKEVATSAYLYGSPNSNGTGSNIFDAGPTSSRLYGAGYSIEVYAFVAVKAYSYTSSDIAYLHGSTTTPNSFGAYPGDGGNGNGTNYGFLRNGDNLQAANGFYYIYAYAGTTADTATFYNFTNLPRTLVGTSTYTYEQDSAGVKFLDMAIGFTSVYSQAGTAQDVVYLYGGVYGRNIFSVAPQVYGGSLGYANLSGSGFSINTAVYHNVYAFAGTAADVAYLHGTYWYDYRPYFSYAYGADYLFMANNFNLVSFYRA